MAEQDRSDSLHKSKARRDAFHRPRYGGIMQFFRLKIKEAQVRPIYRGCYSMTKLSVQCMSNHGESILFT